MRWNYWTVKYRSCWPILILRSNVESYWLIIRKYYIHPSNSLQDIRWNHLTIKYRSCWPVFILRSKVGSNCLIYWKYDTHPSNSLQDIRQNQWTVKYRSLWPTFILRSKVVSHWLIIQKFDVQPSNSLQDKGKITGPWKIGHYDLHYFRIKVCVTPTHYPKVWHSSNKYSSPQPLYNAIVGVQANFRVSYPNRVILRVI